MKIIIDLPDYDGNATDIIWESGSKYAINIEEPNVVIAANKNALISLGKQMLYMAYNELPLGSHVHYDSFFTKMNEEIAELIIEVTE